MASIRLSARASFPAWRAYTGASWAMACPRSASAYRPGALLARPFSAGIARRTAEEGASSQTPPEPSPSPPTATQPEQARSQAQAQAQAQTGPTAPRDSASGSAAGAPFPEFPDFRPRTEYEPPKGTLKSYFIGHHRTALVGMRVKLASVGLVIECRDLRVPLSSSNPLLEATLMKARKAKKKHQPKKSKGGDEALTKEEGGEEDDDGMSLPGLSGHVPAVPERNPLLSVGDTDNRRMRIIVYTKRDLLHREGAQFAPTPAELGRLAAMDADTADAVVFLGCHGPDAQDWRKKSEAELRTLMKALQRAAQAHGERSLTPLYALVVGMPNSGKSTLLNRLRAAGMTDASRRSRAARTGSEAGVTRKLGMPVRVLEDTSKIEDRSDNGPPNAGLLISDTPGVFMPYVPDAETMVKLALTGAVRENLVLPTALADYLLFQLNKRDPQLYMAPYGLTEPTDDANVLLDATARRIGKLGRNGVPDHGAAAQHLVSAYRHGKLGNFCLDDLSADTVRAARAAVRKGPPLSLNQAKKREKVLKRQLMAERRSKRGAALPEY